MIIDWSLIQLKYNEILVELNSQEAIVGWKVPPQDLKVTKHKTKYGMADINGVVYINQAFINSSAVKLLEATIRHELAHLCVGLQHGHNHIFKAKAKSFKSHFGRHLKSETDEIHQNIGFKYLLYATLENGDEVYLRRAHRKNRKYTNYKPTMFKFLTINGRKVAEFKYKSN